MSKHKKAQQLGIDPGTAQARLRKAIMWDMIVQLKQDSCCKCGEAMTLDTYSVEHLTPWLNSEDPVGLFYDIGNIGFSHLLCNIEARRIPRKYHSEEERKAAKKITNAKAHAKRVYDAEERRERYERLGT